MGDDDTGLYRRCQDDRRRPWRRFPEREARLFGRGARSCQEPRSTDRKRTMDVTALRRALVAVPAPVRAERRIETAEAFPEHRGIRPEIQALRAVAVALVVGWHLWPDAVPGGF